ncbi:MAG: amidinotransferase [Desulfovibrionaceae bacterium]|nr:amidinotransferase [Desulfovibrionaceae bacterium]
MFRNALTRLPGRSVIDGLSASPCAGRPDYHKALMQHKAYVEALQNCGLETTCLQALEDFPDSCFIEDVAVLTPKCAIIANPGAPTRRREPEYALDALRRYYESDQICFIKSGNLDGGDVLMVRNHFYIGLSGRSNQAGCLEFIKYLERFGHSGEIVPVTEGLHLKTGVSWLGSNRLLLTKAMARQKAFAAFEHIVVAPEEAAAANCLWIDGKVIMPDGYPSTARALQNAGHHIIKVDISEYEKLDGGLSCLSLRF